MNASRHRPRVGLGDERRAERRIRNAVANAHACATRANLSRRHRLERHRQIMQPPASRKSYRVRGVEH